MHVLCGQTLIKGKITDTHGVGLAGANVYIENTYDGNSSNENGDFEFKTLASGVHQLRIEFIGYVSLVKEVQLNGELIERLFVMEEAFNELDAVVITAGSFEAGDRKRAIELTSMDIATTAGAMGDIIGAINTLPGTNRVGESGRLFVRGGSSEETKTYIDDLQVGNPYYSSAPNVSTRGRFNPFLFSGTIFNTGGYSAEYGQALSSVLLLNTTQVKQQDELNLSFLAGLGADVTATKSWASGSITASGTYFNMNRYAELVQMNQHWIKPVELFTQEISIKQKTGSTGILKWYSNVSQSRLCMEQKNLDTPGQYTRYDQTSKNIFASTSWRNSITEKWMFFSGLSATRNTEKILIDDQPRKEDLTVAHAKAGLDYQLNEKINVRFGGDYFYNDYSILSIADTLESSMSLHNDLVAGYAEANIYTSSKFVVRVGARAEYAMLLKKFNAVPRLSTAYKLGENSQLSMAYGRFYQLPANLDLIIEKNLNFEQADHFLFNYQQTVDQRTLRGEVYYKLYDHLIKYDETSTFDRKNYTNNGGGYAYGLDLFFRDAKSIKNGHYWISYSYLETKRNYRHFPVKSIPGFASKHNFSLVYKHFSNKLRSMISSDISYSSSRPYHDPNKEGFNNAWMKPYYGLNLSWAYLFKTQVIFYMAISNVLGRNNEFGYRYATRADDKGRYERESLVPFSKRFYVAGLFFTFSKDKTRNQLDRIN
jgi:hypothetical protein